MCALPKKRLPPRIGRIERLQFARPPKRAARFGASVLAVFDYLHAIYKNLLHPDCVLVRFFERRAIRDCRRVEHNYIGEHSFPNETAAIEAEVGGRQAA